MEAPWSSYNSTETARDSHRLQYFVKSSGEKNPKNFTLPTPQTMEKEDRIGQQKKLVLAIIWEDYTNIKGNIIPRGDYKKLEFVKP